MRKVTVIDGGFASQLSNHVDKPVDGTPLWSASFLASDPQACVTTHLDFLLAGSQAISTNTYQASIDGFSKHLGLNETESLELIRSAVNLAKEARATYMEEYGTNKGIQKPLIIGSVGPYGAALNDGSEYTGDYVERVSKQDLMDWHRPRIQTLLAAGVDLLALETIPAQVEGEALVQLLKEFPAHKAWLSFSCKDEQHTSHGEKFQEAISTCWELNPSQLVAVGANCVNPKYVTSLIKGINANTASHIPLVIYPNSGEVYNVKTGWSQGENCLPFEKEVQNWLDLGVRYIGGCCRTYPKTINKICAEVELWKKSNTI